MRKIFVCIITTLLYYNIAEAQVGFGGLFPGPGTPASSSVSNLGPGNQTTTSKLQWYGFQPWTTAYASGGGLAANICNATPTCGDVHFVAGGGLNSSDLAAISCASVTTCTVKIFYEQTGSGAPNCTQATTANQPQFFPTGGPGGKAGFSLNSVSGVMNSVCTGITSTAAPYTFILSGVKSTFTQGGNARIWTETDPVGLMLDNADHFELYAGICCAVSTQVISHSTFYSVIGSTTGSASTARMNVSGHVDTGLNAGGSSNITSVGEMESTDQPAQSVTVGAFGTYAQQLSSSDEAAINTINQNFWGI